jgi:hypothetical protein
VPKRAQKKRRVVQGATCSLCQPPPPSLIERRPAALPLRSPSPVDLRPYRPPRSTACCTRASPAAPRSRASRWRSTRRWSRWRRGSGGATCTQTMWRAHWASRWELMGPLLGLEAAAFEARGVQARAAARSAGSAGPRHPLRPAACGVPPGPPAARPPHPPAARVDPLPGSGDRRGGRRAAARVPRAQHGGEPAQMSRLGRPTHAEGGAPWLLGCPIMRRAAAHVAFGLVPPWIPTLSSVAAPGLATQRLLFRCLNAGAFDPIDFSLMDLPGGGAAAHTKVMQGPR